MNEKEENPKKFLTSLETAELKKTFLKGETSNWS